MPIHKTPRRKSQPRAPSTGVPPCHDSPVEPALDASSDAAALNEAVAGLYVRGFPGLADALARTWVAVERCKGTRNANRDEFLDGLRRFGRDEIGCDVFEAMEARFMASREALDGAIRDLERLAESIRITLDPMDDDIP